MTGGADETEKSSVCLEHLNSHSQNGGNTRGGGDGESVGLRTINGGGGGSGGVEKGTGQ